MAVDFLGLRPYLAVNGFRPDGWASKPETLEPEQKESLLKVAGATLVWPIGTRSRITHCL